MGHGALALWRSKCSGQYLWTFEPQLHDAVDGQVVVAAGLALHVDSCDVLYPIPNSINNLAQQTGEWLVLLTH